MAATQPLFAGRHLPWLLALLLLAGFFATTLSSYYVSREAIRNAILDQELPLASNHIYAEIQKDLVRPVLISSTMAADTFLRDWVLAGERDVDQMARYLREIKQRYGAFSSFFVSERSGIYYTAEGVLKRVSPKEPRDAWYYRVRDLAEPYEINVDPDLANRDALTIFINYRVFDYEDRYLGATGVGLTVDAVRQLIADYQQRYARDIYFVDEKGRVVLFGSRVGGEGEDLRARPGLGPLVDTALARKNGSYQFEVDGTTHLLNVHYVPELKWFLFMEKDEDEALADIRRTLYVNLAVCLAITVLVAGLMRRSLLRYQRRMEEMASIDKLTGLLNRQAFVLWMDKLLADYRRSPRPFSVLLADIDHFKLVNDRYGHPVGDLVLRGVADVLRGGLRESDISVRWGGEEFLIVLRGCDLAEAGRIAENLRQAVEQARFEAAKETIAVTISIGVAEYDGSEMPERTIDRADTGLYDAKHAGRNRVGMSGSSAAPAP